MKRFTILLFVIIIMILPLIGSDNVKINSNLPAGFTKGQSVRVVPLIETLRIDDESGDFFFRRPRRIKIAPDGSIFVQESEKLYQFDASGKYIRNYFKKGEGPGELKYLSNFYFLKDTVVMAGYMPFTVLKKSLTDGSIINEYKDPAAKPITLLIAGNPIGYFVAINDVQFSKLKTGVSDRNNKILFYDSSNVMSDPGLSFNTIDTMIKISGKDGRTMIAMNEVTHLLYAFENDKYGYLSHTKRYQIKQIDLKSKKVIKEFNRPYQPVKYIERKYESKEDRQLDTQVNREFFNDIHALRMFGDKLMVFTSTIDEEKGVMVDVFNSKGEYIDCIFIKLPDVKRPDDLRRKPIYFGKDCLWTSYADEDEDPVVVKYQFNL